MGSLPRDHHPTGQREIPPALSRWTSGMKVKSPLILH